MTAPGTHFGMALQVHIREQSIEEELYNLILRFEDGREMVMPASRHALRSLWAYLTKILYPRASDQLTERIETVRRTALDIPEDAAYVIIAEPHARMDEVIILACLSRQQPWTVFISQELGHDLWTKLEDYLDQV